MSKVPTVRSLPIVWQRLVSPEGETCVRCSRTQDQLEKAVGTLGHVLRPLRITPHLEVVEIDDPTFRANPSESNRIWISGTPLETWLAGRVGSSRCCSVCGDAPCRTIEIGGTAFEEIPERLIVKAALLAAAELLDDEEHADDMIASET
jgi:hypothetical protein